MSALWFDLRFTLRLLSRAPGFALLSVVVIALAMSLALAIYVIVRNNGLEPLPLPRGDRYVALEHVFESSGLSLRGDQFHVDTLQAMQARGKSYELLGGSRMHGSLTINDGGLTEAPWGTEISPSLMQATEVQPFMGRLFTDEDARAGAPEVALIGHNLWQTFFGGREDIIGYQVRIASEPHTIIGVMPEGFRYPTDHHIWRPLKLMPNSPPGDHSQHFTIVGILKAGVSMSQASAEAAAIVADLQRQYPVDYENLTARAIPYVDAASVSEFRTINLVMLAAALSILLLACLNVGNLLLVRASERNHELAIRSALGGTRVRIVRQILMESFLICVAGSVLGLWLGSYGARFVQYQTELVVGSAYLPFWMRFDISTDVYVLVGLVTALIWFMAGGIPAWRASSASSGMVLAGGNKGVVSRRSSRTTSALVAAEVVFSFFLLVLSGAFVSSVKLASEVDFGVSMDNRVVGMLLFDQNKYAEPAQRIAYFDRFIEELENENVVRSASYTVALPGMSWATMPFDLRGLKLAEYGEMPLMQALPVGHGYMEKNSFELLQGRFFELADDLDSLPVVIIQQQMAEQYWPDESPLGKMISVNPDNDKSGFPPENATIVGVVADVDQGQALGRSRGVANVYFPLAQKTPSHGYVITHFIEQPKDYERFVKEVASRVDRDMAFNRISSLDVSMSLNVRTLKAYAELFIMVAIIALVLAGTGIYGVVSRSVLLRTREMGIRRALGQTDESTLYFFLRQGLYFLLVGALLGGAGAILAAWLLTPEFPSLLDSMFIIAIIICTIMTALVLSASYLPARRMIALEPAVALHHE